MLLVLTWQVLIVAGAVLLFRIMAVDFQSQKIRNDNVLQLLVVGVALRAVEYSIRFDASLIWQPLAISAALFVVLIGLWLAGKLGAGDVKLLSVIPITVGVNGIIPFAVAFMAFAILVYLSLKYPALLPRRQWRDVAAQFTGSNRVPFGVPIGAAGIVAMLALLPAATLSPQGFRLPL